MFLLMLLSACAPKTASVTPSAAPANAAHVTLVVADLAPSGPEDAPNARLSLAWVDATGATLGTATIAETIGGCSTREPADGALFEVGCWWAGGGPEYRAVVRDGAVVVQTRDVDEGLRKPTAWRDLSENTLAPGQSVSYLQVPPPPDYVALAAATAHLLPPVTMNEGDRPTDCNLQDPGSWDPLLAAAQAGGTAPVVVRGKNGIAETVVLGDGTEVRVVRGGCEHVGETWSVAPVPATPHIAAMRQVIGKLTLNPAASPSLVKCLDDAHEAEQIGFGCGEAYVSRSVQGDVLEFTWSFAL